VVKKAMGGLLFIDKAYCRFRPENEHDSGQVAIEMLPQVMKNTPENLVVFLAGYTDRMNSFFPPNPGFRSRIALHRGFPDSSLDELAGIAEITDRMVTSQEYRVDDASRRAFREYLELRMPQPHFADARSVRDAIDAQDIRHSRVFDGGI
jgi:hypothetical protein